MSSRIYPLADVKTLNQTLEKNMCCQQTAGFLLRSTLPFQIPVGGWPINYWKLERTSICAKHW